MNRIDQCLRQLKADGRKALATYIVNGDPHPSITLLAMHALVKAGADIIELGVPFSDPMAEGPVIQRGHERALVHHTSLKSTLALVKQFRATNAQTPVLLMGYSNPIERMGYSLFAEQAAEAGVDGLLTVDLPPEEGEDLQHELKEKNIHTIFLLAPTTAANRMAMVAENASGFLYYVSLKGVTGAANLDVESVRTQLAHIRECSDLPVLVGFGIKDADSAKAIAVHADGVVVGSALVDIMGQEAESETTIQLLGAKVASIREGLDGLL